MEHMTTLSAQRFECALRISSTKEAAEALLHYHHFRTLGDVLSAFSGQVQPKNLLVDGLLLWFPESNRSAIDRKVRNWLSGKTQSIAKEDAYILSSILGLTPEQTNDFLKQTAGEGIHWRDPRDIVWCYSILHRLSPAQTRSLLEQADGLCKAADRNTAPSKIYTAMLYEKLQPVLYGSEAQLLDFLQAERDNLGQFHNTAYQMFLQFMTLLEEGFSDADVEALFLEMTQKEKQKKESDAAARKETARTEAMQAGLPFDDDPSRKKTLADLDGDTELYQPEPLSTRDVLETYLYRNFVPTGNLGGTPKTDPFFAVRRSLRQSWPDESTLSRMKNRQTDVSRKVLILLFLATNGSCTDFEQMEDDVPYTREEAFLDFYTRLNLMLNSCGFLKLDPRSPFDWMILYCICAGDLWESDVRLRNMLSEIFPEEAV